MLNKNGTKCDKCHLLVALLRALDISAGYSHATCYFKKKQYNCWTCMGKSLP